MEKKIVFIQTEIKSGNNIHHMVCDKEKQLNISKTAKKKLNASIKMEKKMENNTSSMKMEA